MSIHAKQAEDLNPDILKEAIKDNHDLQELHQGPADLKGQKDNDPVRLQNKDDAKTADDAGE